MPSTGPLFLTDSAAEQAWNEELLTHHVTEPKVRLWTYAQPGIVLGCSQAGLLSSHNRGRNYQWVRRRAGGGAVLTGPWMLSASIVLPPGHALVGSNTVANYRWLGELYGGLLRDMGVHRAHAVPPNELTLYGCPDPALKWACFAGISPWEVVVDGKKIMGMAQLARRTGTLLASGLLLAPPNWRILCEELGQPLHHANVLAESTISCAEVFGSPISIEFIANRIFQMMVDVLGRSVLGACEGKTPGSLSARRAIPVAP